MEYIIGLDVSLKESSACVVDQHGNLLRETKVPSEPEDLIAFVRGLPHKVTCVGIEAGPLSQWLHQHLTEAGIAVALMETRHVKAVLKASPIKTDRRDAQGLAHLLRMGWFRPVHCKSVSSQEMRALLSGRKALQSAMLNLESAIRGVLRNFGLKVGPISKGKFEARIRELAEGNTRLDAMVEAILQGRAALREEFVALDDMLVELAEGCLLSAPKARYLPCSTPSSFAELVQRHFLEGLAREAYPLRHVLVEAEGYFEGKAISTGRAILPHIAGSLEPVRKAAERG